MKNLLFPFVTLITFILSGCGGSSSYTPLAFEEGSQEAIDNLAVISYLDKKNINAKHTDSGIYYIIEKAGEGEHPSPTSTVTTHYTGSFMESGEQFDSSIDKGEPISFSLTGVIPGWKEAIPLLKPGGKGKFFIPSGLAYGVKGYPGRIPPNSNLIFEVELIEFKDQKKIDENTIAGFCSENNLEYQKTASGIYYKIEKEGEGEHPQISSKVTCHYRGTFLDGEPFDSSYDSESGEPVQFPLNQVISGWQECIPMLKKGGKGKFIIPSELAYGSRGYPGSIPPNTVLMFEVELIDF